MFRTSRSLARACAPLLFAVVAGLGSPVLAQSAATINQQLGTAGASERFPLNAQVSLSHSVGSASFVASQTPNPTLSSTLALMPTARLAPGWMLGLDSRVGIEWTQSDTTTYANQLELSDLGVRLTYTGFGWDDLGLRLALSGGYNLPLSLASRQAGSTGAMAVGSRLMWSNESGISAYGSARASLNPIVAALAGRFANQPGKPLVDRSLGELSTLTYIRRPSTSPDAFGALEGRFPTGFGWSAGGGIGYTPAVLDGALFFGLDLVYAQGFSAFTGPDDEFTSQNAKAGLIPRQSTQANLAVSYTPTSWLTVTGGAFSGQPFLSSDNKGVRIPLVDGFVHAPSNMASVYVDTTFMF